MISLGKPVLQGCFAEVFNHLASHMIKALTSIARLSIHKVALVQAAAAIPRVKIGENSAARESVATF